MRALSANLYRHDDTCAVYLLRSGDEAAAIDFGSGDVLDALPSIGVARLRDVLVTHHHRDQVQGLARAVAAGARVWVPHTEQDLVARVDQHWQARPLRNSYDTREDRFSLLESVPIAGTLRDYGSVVLGRHELTVVPTPGHTTGSISLLGTIDGRRCAFTGDLIHSPGRLWSLAATQWSYNGGEGVAASVASLLDLRDRDPQVLLPSHGEPIEAPAPAIDLLVHRLTSLMRARGQNPRLFELRERPFEALTANLLMNRTSVAQHYVLLSASGAALFIDFGYDFVTGVAAGADRASRRPSLATVPALRRDHGVTAIEVAVPTHYHDDHVAGLDLLRAVEGTQVWAAELVADVLERPEAHDLPCLWYDPIPVDRRLPLESPITWREHELTLHHLPGHAHHAVAISFEVDGARVLAVGDQYQGGAEAAWNYVYDNGFGIGDYAASAELYRRLAPDLVLSGHWPPLRPDDAYLRAVDEGGALLDALHRELLPSERRAAGPFGAAGDVARIQPYHARLAPGQRGRVEVLVSNRGACERLAEVELVAPVGLEVEPARRSALLGPGADAALAFSVRAGATPGRRYRIAADVTLGAVRFGQAAEALMTIEEEP
jgi:glyoxylase-like metal-dependent hydrolase (beta-lactamase superfamily II)